MFQIPIRHTTYVPSYDVGEHFSGRRRLQRFQNTLDSQILLDAIFLVVSLLGLLLLLETGPEALEEVAINFLNPASRKEIGIDLGISNEVHQ